MGKLLGNNAIDTLVISPEILGFIAEIDEFKGAWLSLGVHAPDRLNALRHIATIESVGSSTRIEDWHPWVKYFLQLLVRQCRELKKKIDHEKIMLAKLPDLSFHIVDHARNHGRVTLADVVVATGANRNTIKKHFAALVKKKYLLLRGRGPASWYELS